MLYDSDFNVSKKGKDYRKRVCNMYGYENESI